MKNPTVTIDSMALEELCFHFDAAVPIFHKISFELPKSGAVWINTRSGDKGRSTLIRILAGLAQPTSGRYLINGQDVTKMSFEEFLPYRMRIGYGFDMGGLMNNRTIFENLALPLQYHGLCDHDEVIQKVGRALDFFSLSKTRGLRPSAISGSQRKLTCLVRAFIHNPQVVFLDDPLTGLKDNDVTRLIQFIREGQQSRGLKQVFFTSEKRFLPEQLQAEELLIGAHFFKVRPMVVAA